MISHNIGYGYNDVTLVPAQFTEIEHRSDINPYIYENILPIFAAPMTTIVSESNIDVFIKNGIMPIIPRGMFSHKDDIDELDDFGKRMQMLCKGYWTAFSLNETNRALELIQAGSYNKLINNTELKFCIDVANGHMISIYHTAYKLKKYMLEHNFKIRIMTGNIANSETFNEINSSEYAPFRVHYNDTYYNTIDFIRVGIGGGSGCITSPQTSVHCAQATLIDNCASWKNYRNTGTKIIADGGIRNYGDVIKALALGADYVMIGGLFASTIESAGDKYALLDQNNKPTCFCLPEDLNMYKKCGYFTYGPSNITCDKIYTEFYGMASKQGQHDMFGKKINTSEGTIKYVEVTTTLQQWTENMAAYLRSAMSYCNCKSLNKFIGKQTLIPTAYGEINSVNK